METLLQDAGQAAVTDDAMHKVYDEAVKQMANEQEVHARHILVPTEDEAKAIEAELKKGADFATLAKEKSKDPGAAEGGDLGYFTKDQMVPEFAEVAFKLDKGQISDPVKTQFGWHIIKVEDKRTKPTPTFDEVKSQIQTYVAHRAQAELVQKLRERRQYRAPRSTAGGACRSVDAQSGGTCQEITAAASRIVRAAAYASIPVGGASLRFVSCCAAAGKH